MSFRRPPEEDAEDHLLHGHRVHVALLQRENKSVTRPAVRLLLAHHTIFIHPIHFAFSYS